MEKVNKVDFENKQIPINVFESIQIDFRPTKAKKRRQVEDYDYNDDFLEAFEGELDPVELECKLENFFIYKGHMEEDPKRIARRYNNSLKKTKLMDSIKNAEQKQETAVKHPILFEFQKMLANAYNFNSKYKRETKFENAIMCLVFDETPADDFERYLKYKLLALYDKSKFGDEMLRFEDVPLDFNQKEQDLKNQIEDTFKDFLKISNDKSNFSNDRKIFEKFQDELFVKDLVCFFIKYMKFYVLKTDEPLARIKNSALEYLNAMLPEQCTNKVKIKHYLLKYIDKEIQDKKYDLSMVMKGEFVVRSKDDASKNEGNSWEESDKNKRIKTNSDTSVLDRGVPKNNTLSFQDTMVSSSSTDAKAFDQTQSYENSEFLQLDASKEEKLGKKPHGDLNGEVNSKENPHYRSSYNFFNDISSNQHSAVRSTPNFGLSQFRPQTLSKYLKYPSYDSNYVNDFDRLQIKKNPQSKVSKKSSKEAESLNALNPKNEEKLKTSAKSSPTKRKYTKKLRETDNGKAKDKNTAENALDETDGLHKKE